MRYRPTGRRNRLPIPERQAERTAAAAVCRALLYGDGRDQTSEYRKYATRFTSQLGKTSPESARTSS